MSTAPDSPLRVESPPTGAKKHSGRPFVFLESREQCLTPQAVGATGREWRQPPSRASLDFQDTSAEGAA